MRRQVFFGVPRFAEEYGTRGLFSEEEGESLHHEINFESAQLSCVRSDPERLWLVVERHDQCSQADHSLLTPPPRKRVGSTQDKFRVSVFSISFFFHCHVYGVLVIQHHLCLVYALIGSNWFVLVGWAGCWCWRKKQLSYIILFVWIWSEHNIFFPNVLALFVSVFVCALKRGTKKIRKSCINFYVL